MEPDGLIILSGVALGATPVGPAVCGPPRAIPRRPRETSLIAVAAVAGLTGFRAARL
ncbi:hypothetical protein SGLAU_31305 [Streptomyces glaucescens]|uniref:Uncharacterized protein n=1 Tax=Streptomyces glaucescens TaxID=1907 RepID=A0A089XLS9_STRGA|nr:hypothetical protein SGLAU_31305 [Streptomyces glaucescens]